MTNRKTAVPFFATTPRNSYDDYEYLEPESDDDDYYYDSSLTSNNYYQWETYNGVDILLPPPPPPNSKTPTPPRAIIHFIGGTFLGSLPPRIVYSRFLTQLASSCQRDVIIIATPISLFGGGSNPDSRRGGLLTSPLDHFKVVNDIQQKFQRVVDDVLIDDIYGWDVMEDVPVVGVGHSLGGRLHVLSDMVAMQKRRRRQQQQQQEEQFLSNDDNKRKRQRRRMEMMRHEVGHGRNWGNVLISFNNWSAEESVPLLNGLKSVVKMFNRGDQKQQQRQQQRGRRQRIIKPSSSSSSSSSMFEFNPPPNVLWDMLDDTIADEYEQQQLQQERRGRGRQQQLMIGRYTVSNNLIVQFDRDDLDQSSELAHKLVSSSSKEEEENSDDDDDGKNNSSKMDVRFAALRGDHLTPCFGFDNVDEYDDEYDDDNDWYDYRNENQRQQPQPQQQGKRSRKNDKKAELDDLVSSVASYIDDIINYRAAITTTETKRD